MLAKIVSTAWTGIDGLGCSRDDKKDPDVAETLPHRSCTELEVEEAAISRDDLPVFDLDASLRFATKARSTETSRSPKPLPVVGNYVAAAAWAVARV
ncbi:hypothetical protein GW17_00044324 [Ensete ventricosum]|nr:hypothetical protein GW17_00044324 [Ensete ventricosum]